MLVYDVLLPYEDPFVLSRMGVLGQIIAQLSSEVFPLFGIRGVPREAVACHARGTIPRCSPLPKKPAEEWTLMSAVPLVNRFFSEPVPLTLCKNI
jgi:hypothetical protein